MHLLCHFSVKLLSILLLLTIQYILTYYSVLSDPVLIPVVTKVPETEKSPDQALLECIELQGDDSDDTDVEIPMYYSDFVEEEEDEEEELQHA